MNLNLYFHDLGFHSLFYLQNQLQQIIVGVKLPQPPPTSNWPELYRKIGIRNRYGFEALMAHPQPKCGQMHHTPGSLAFSSQKILILSSYGVRALAGEGGLPISISKTITVIKCVSISLSISPQ